MILRNCPGVNAKRIKRLLKGHTLRNPQQISNGLLRPDLYMPIFGALLLQLAIYRTIKLFMKNAIDNIALMKKFWQGEESLLANRELRIEKALDEIHLLTTQGTLLAKGRFASNHPKGIVRLKSDYWQLLHQLALEVGFIPLKLDQERSAGVAFAQYDYHSVPAGYQIHCQAASAFWKTWWINHRKLQLMDMLLLCDRRWYPVSKMLCDTGTIYLKTWQGEKVLALSDIVVWLDRHTQEPRQQRSKQPVKSKSRPSAYPYHTDSAKEQPTRSAAVSQPKIPTELQQVIWADAPDRLTVHTVLGPVIIKGHNLTCTLAHEVAEVS